MSTWKAPAISTMTIIFVGILLSACGPRLVRGQSPYVSIQGIELDGENLVLGLHVQNINDVDIEASSVRFTLDLDGEQLVSYDAASNASVIANGTETLRFESRASERGRSLLESLERGDVQNLEYSISGEINSADEGSLSFSGDGRIYPVPGRPGEFR
jgi:LEA14-like dessication related protein